MRKIYLKTWLSVAVLFFSLAGYSQGSWKEVSESSIQKNLFAGGRYKPDVYRIFQLDENSMSSSLKQAPGRSAVPVSRSSFILTIPDSDGKPQRFRAVESSVMEPALAAKYPDIKTYVGQGIDDPSATIHFDFSPRGFHAMILSVTRKTMYIDPVDRDGKYYVVFSRKDIVNYKNEFHCLTKESASTNSIDVPAPPAGTGRGADDGKLRTYRLALACTGEYANYFLNGTEPDDAAKKAKVLAAMATLLVRTNGIYERDFGIHMNLIANNDLLIYLNASTDPWTNEWNDKTQATIDNVIGNANYDIGHLVHKEASAANNNGNAGCIACVCKTGMKGSAFTSHVAPEGDPFVVDFTTHEMGHQFGGTHTYNIINEQSGSLMEPGSGSTIMGYAGITGANTDVQPHSDDYFHAKNIEQITDYIKGATGGGCAVVTTTGNATPTIDAGASYTIPHSTPFTLTGTAADADAADVLSYTWEQYNSGNAANPVPSTDNTFGPVFRSRPYSASPSRTFPILASILDGTNGNKWERLPSVARTLAFRFTVRDNHPGGGNTRDANMNVTVNGNSGPFAVTTPNTNVNWFSGFDQTITWLVNNSDLAPVSCANVKISLSTDGGLTFPTVLAASTPNDGSEVVNIPAITSNTCRIKVEAVGNIFFDISNVNFALVPAVPSFAFNNPAAASVTCATQNSAAITLGVTSILGYTTPVTLSAGTLPAGTTISFGTNPVTPGGSSVVTLNNTGGLTAGTYNVVITGVSGSITNTRTLTFTVQPGAGPIITTQPQSTPACAASTAVFSVTATNATAYQWQVSTNGGTSFTNVATGGNNAAYSVAGVTTALNNYQYRVLVSGQCGISTSAAATLTVQTAPSITTPPQSATLCLGSPATFSVTATGTALVYQWQVSSNGGTSYSAAPGVNNGATYTIPVITTDMDNNRYRVVISGTCAPVATSAGALLTVISPVVITDEADDITICETGNVSFTVAGTSSVPVIYQWQVSTDGGTNYTNITNGGAYGGATTPTLTVSNVAQAMNNNRYRALLSNATCTTPVTTNTGDPAILTVNARPTVNLTAAPFVNILPGQTTTISAAINPAPTGFNITWLKNDQLIPGINGTSYLVDSVEVGNYKVQIVNTTTGCNNESNVLTIGTSASTNLFIFPTPNDGRFTVSYYNSTGAAGKQTLAVYDSRGQRVYNAQFNVNGPYTLHDINLRGSARGIYYVVIGDGSGKKITEGKIMIY